VTVGDTITDTAHLGGGYGTLTGTISFDVFAPGDTQCGNALTSPAGATVNGAGDYTSGDFTTTTAGIYRWIAHYSGDTNNGAVDTACNDANESSTVNVPVPAVIGIAKRVVGTPVKISPGTWDVTFEFLVKNYGAGDLSALQVTDNLILTFPTPTTFTVLSVSSAEFTVNWSSPTSPGDYNGMGNNNLLTGIDTLAVGGQGKITVIVRVVPASAGPFYNTAVASGQPPTGPRVSDDSSDGINPDNTNNCPSCVNGDNNPNNNTKPTPIPFSPHLFDPPFGVKLVNDSGLPELAWTMVWINGSNIVPINAAVSDPIPLGTIYVNGSLSCTGASSLTTTTSCAYETPSIMYPRGRVVWTGTLGPDLGATDAATANNELYIIFRVTVNPGVDSVLNTGTIDSDLNGDGDTNDSGEQHVATASNSWTNASNPSTLPGTGFAPGRLTVLSPQTVSYDALGDLWLEIPRLGVQMPIVGVPQSANGNWDVTWLGNDAGWLNGSAYPTWKGNSVITGHVTDVFGNPGPFARLNTLWWGDKIIVHASGGQYVYEVRSVQQSGPGNINAMMKHEELPWVTLVTCRGYDAASNSYLYRILVRAVLVEVK